MYMNRTEPKIMPGFMELLPADQILFNKMYDTIRRVYERFGFSPLDTPILEYSEILLAKAGGETEKQIYRFNKGDTDISMRFDLTVPLARYVAEHYPEIAFPFKRYQMGKVYRGERPQKGRFREFYQCDIDVIGNEQLDLLNDAEIPVIIYSVFKEMGFNEFKIRLNNRKILNGLFASLNLTDVAPDILRLIDKIDKIGRDDVSIELRKIGVSDADIALIINFILIKGSIDEVISKIKDLNISNDLYNIGIEELGTVAKTAISFGLPVDNLDIDLTIARGLDYYTGTIYETTLNDYPNIGSICSGGRYDNLAEYYTDRKLPGVGISIGLTRLFYQLREANIIKASNSSPAKVLVIPMSQSKDYALEIAGKLRDTDIATDVYLQNKNIKNKIQYADRLGIPFVIFIGEDEEREQKVTIRNLSISEQKVLSLDETIEEIKRAIK